MGNRANTILQTCFFALSGVLPREEAIAKIKEAIKKTYSKKGEEIVLKNFAAVDQTLAHLYQVCAATANSTLEMPPIVPPEAPDFVQEVTAKMMAGRAINSGLHCRWTAPIPPARRLGKTQCFRLCAGMGARSLHSMRKLQFCLSAWRDSLQIL